MKKLIVILSSIICFCIACNKEEVAELPPCLHVPCNDTVEYYNRVAQQLGYRIGTWINVQDYSSESTLIFHSDSILTNINADSLGIHNGKYDFNYPYIRLYKNYGNEELEEPIVKETKYNDTTGVFSILNQSRIGVHGGDNYQHWAHYIKIE